MAHLSVIKDRVRTISNLRKVTRAMELVTKTKINKIRQNANAALLYQQNFQELFTTIAHAYEQEHPEGKALPVVYYVAFFSQKGFCGNFNDKLLTRLATVANDPAKAEAKIFLLGKKTSKWGHYIRRPYDHIEARERSYREECLPLYNAWLEDIKAGRSLQIHFIYNKFKTILEQTPQIKQIYPFDMEEQSQFNEPMFEPSLSEMFNRLVEDYLQGCLEHVYWESLAGEYCSRLISMKNANDNPTIIIDDLQLAYNKARQGKITQELSEIVSAFDVLKLVQDKKEREGA
jgi:F-type H+-transporting ATPase subunit gamma